jgi:fatty-acyl-CoA synthase
MPSRQRGGRVEAVAVQLDAVANCAVVGVADRRWGKVCAAYVQSREGATLLAAELRAHLETEISARHRGRHADAFDLHR